MSCSETEIIELSCSVHDHNHLDEVANKSSTSTLTSTLIETSKTKVSVVSVEDTPRRCHQTDLKILGRSRIKEGWWAGAVDVEMNGQTLLMKRYEGSSQEALQVCHVLVEVQRSPLSGVLIQSIGVRTCRLWSKRSEAYRCYRWSPTDC